MIELWYFDIGARVKIVDFSPTIDTPEADQQYAAVRGDLPTPAIRNRLAASTVGRSCLAQAVFQQTDDATVVVALVSPAAVGSDDDRIRAMEDVESIMVPFVARIVWPSTEPMNRSARVEIATPPTHRSARELQE